MARWTPIALLSTGPYVLVVSNKLGVSSVKELVDRAKANPNKITSATPGIGSVGHLATVQLEMLAGITTTQVPYKGLSPAVNDIVAGHVDLMFDTPTTSLPLHHGGKVKMIGTGTPERVRAEHRFGREVVDEVLRVVLDHRDLLEHHLALGVDVGQRRHEAPFPPVAIRRTTG